MVVQHWLWQGSRSSREIRLTVEMYCAFNIRDVRYILKNNCYYYYHLTNNNISKWLNQFSWCSRVNAFHYCKTSCDTHLSAVLWIVMQTSPSRSDCEKDVPRRCLPIALLQLWTVLFYPRRLPCTNSAVVHWHSCVFRSAQNLCVLPAYRWYGWQSCLQRGRDHNQTPTLLFSSLELSIVGANWFPCHWNPIWQRTTAHLKLIISLVRAIHYVWRGHCLILWNHPFSPPPHALKHVFFFKSTHTSLHIAPHVSTQIYQTAKKHLTCAASSKYMNLEEMFKAFFFVISRTQGKCCRKSPNHFTLDFPYTTGSYIIEQHLCESAGCLYDNWKIRSDFSGESIVL